MRIDPDFAAAVASVAVVGGYHVFLRARVRANPNYTIQALLNRARAAWVLRMMEEREGILAVQSMRNVIMGATFFATTAVALIVGTITLSIQGDKLTQAWSAGGPLGLLDPNLWLLKMLVLLVDMLAAFVCFSQAIRLFSHVSMLIGVPKDVVGPAMVAHLFIRGGRYHTRGMRCYYLAGPMLFWLFGPIPLFVSSCVLVVMLYALDRAPEEEAGQGEALR